MTDEELLKITDSMQEKLGDSAGVIADDIGLLITGNANSQKALVAKDEEIKRLTSTNEKLVLANGNLLKQIPVEKSLPPQDNSEVDKPTKINLADAFDVHGNFKR